MKPYLMNRDTVNKDHIVRALRFLDPAVNKVEFAYLQPFEVAWLGSMARQILNRLIESNKIIICETSVVEFALSLMTLHGQRHKTKHPLRKLTSLPRQNGLAVVASMADSWPSAWRPE